MDETPVKKKRGPKPGTERAKHGGQALVRLYGRGHMAEMGRRGGEITHEKYGADYYGRIGGRGGRITSAKYGPEYYSRIGKAGAAQRVRNAQLRRMNERKNSKKERSA